MGIIDSRSVKTSHHDSKGAPKVVENLEHKFLRLRKILADGGYRKHPKKYI